MLGKEKLKVGFYQIGNDFGFRRPLMPIHHDVGSYGNLKYTILVCREHRYSTAM